MYFLLLRGNEEHSTLPAFMEGGMEEAPHCDPPSEPLLTWHCLCQGASGPQPQPMYSLVPTEHSPVTHCTRPWHLLHPACSDPGARWQVQFKQLHLAPSALGV
jgi:hypothetical protein